MEKNEDCPPEQVPLVRQSGLLMILETSKGRGVFTEVAIAASTVIEVSPVLVMPTSDLVALESSLLSHYSYNWPNFDLETGKSISTQAVALGLGSLFNHSRRQNVGFRRDLQRQCITYTTLRDILAGEELCISYGSRLWFDDMDGASESPPAVEPTNDLTRIELSD